MRQRQNGRHFPDDIFKCIFLSENILILIKISQKFVPRGLININPVLVQIMAWRWPGGEPLSEAITLSLLTHICITLPQWVNPCCSDNLSCTDIPNWNCWFYIMYILLYDNIKMFLINLLNPGRCSNFISVISKHILQIKFTSTSYSLHVYEIALRWMP